MIQLHTHTEEDHVYMCGSDNMYIEGVNALPQTSDNLLTVQGYYLEALVLKLL